MDAVGRGIYLYNKTKRYEGEWKDGNPHGEGRMIAGMESYQGQWKNGLKDGQGRMRYANGDVYEGEWMRGVKWGMGTLTTKDGVMTGTWESG